MTSWNHSSAGDDFVQDQRMGVHLQLGFFVHYRVGDGHTRTIQNRHLFR